MEAAAKTVQLLTQRILPERPHHLAYSTDRRFRVPPDDARVFEEEIYRGLQYMSLLSDADRGVLFTRSYYDMREEPPAANESQTTNNAVRIDKKPSTKISLSDYKNKQKKQSESPPQDRMGLKPPVPRSIQETRESEGPKRKEGGRAEKLEAQRNGKSQRPRDAPVEERPAQPSSKTPSIRDDHNPPDNRKRPTDQDDAARVIKRIRNDTNGAVQEKIGTPRDNAQANAPRAREPISTEGKSPQSNSKAVSSSAKANDRSILKSSLHSSHSSSPNARGRVDSLNGGRADSNESAKVTPVKPTAAPAKPTVPPLLSPLHLSFGDTEPVSKTEKPRRELSGEVRKSGMGNTLEPPGITKKQRSPLRIPPLLSPTLPPEVEAELTRLKKSGAKVTESRGKSEVTSDLSGAEKKGRPAREETGKEGIQTRRLVVTMKYPKRMAKSVQRLLALPPKKESAEKERSASIEAPAQHAKKRPLAQSENVADSIAAKRPRPSETLGMSRLPAPSTPSKHSTAMSRIGSSHSHANTPGEVPGRSPLGVSSSSRPSTSQDSGDFGHKLQPLKRRYDMHNELGRKLKHERDALLRKNTRRLNENNGDPPHVPESDSKLAIIIGLEAVLAYMIAFRSLGDMRHLERKREDPLAWKSLLPLLEEIKRTARGERVLNALLFQIHGVLEEELIKAYLATPEHLGELAKALPERTKVWRAARDASDRVDQSVIPNLGPWSTVEDAVQKSMVVMRKWVEKEHLRWTPEVKSNSVPNGA